MDRAKASGVVDQAMIVSGKPESASAQGRQSAESTMQGAGAAAWVVFLAVALALAIGIGGGALGAKGAQRVNWSGAGSRRA
jgi:hypothetical protein